MDMSEVFLESSDRLTPELPVWAEMPADPVFMRCEALIDSVGPKLDATMGDDETTGNTFPLGTHLRDFAQGIAPLYDSVKAYALFQDSIGNRAHAVASTRRRYSGFTESAQAACNYALDRHMYATAIYNSMTVFPQLDYLEVLDEINATPPDEKTMDLQIFQEMLEAARDLGDVQTLMSGLEAVVVQYSIRAVQIDLGLSLLHYGRQKPDLSEISWLAGQLLEFMHYEGSQDRHMELASLAVTQNVDFSMRHKLAIRHPMTSRQLVKAKERLKGFNARVKEFDEQNRQAIRDRTGNARDEYEALTAAHQMSGSEIRKSPYAPLFSALVNSGITFEGRQPDKQEARWIVSSMRLLAQYAMRGSNLRESSVALYHATQHEMTMETVHEKRLQGLTDLERYKYMLPLKQGLSARIAWLIDHRDKFLPFAAQHVPSLEGLMNRMNMLLGGPDAYANAESIPLPEAPKEKVRQESGQIVLREVVEVAGELDWRMVPPEEIGPRDPAAGQKLVKRLRERYSRRRVEEQRILDFAEIWHNFGGEIWENIITEPGAALLFEHEGQPLVLAEWFTRGKASYLLKCEEDVSWRGLLRLHRRDLVKRGGLQLIHPPLSDDGTYRRGDHQIAVLAAAEELRRNN